MAGQARSIPIRKEVRSVRTREIHAARDFRPPAYSGYRAGPQEEIVPKHEFATSPILGGDTLGRAAILTQLGREAGATSPGRGKAGHPGANELGGAMGDSGYRAGMAQVLV